VGGGYGAAELQIAFAARSVLTVSRRRDYVVYMIQRCNSRRCLYDKSDMNLRDGYSSLILRLYDKSDI
jgi:hypothetical protein